MKRFKTVDAYVAGLENWQDEIVKLRDILRSMDLEETVKWGAPVYVANGKNIVGLAAFKSHCAIWFFQGALLADQNQVLINAQEGKTKALRQWRFTNFRDIKTRWIKNYVREAIELARQGRQIKPDRNQRLVIPPELKQALAKDKKAKVGFEAMTKSCRREYAQHIAEAKREDTKQRRLKKILPMIRSAQGLHDKYR
jgi:uncharacterized protein YdeI (YjbR/CyaY-like superfamily)